MTKEYDLVNVERCPWPVVSASALELLFAEELGLVLEVDGSNVQQVTAAYEQQGAQCERIGVSLPEATNSLVS